MIGQTISHYKITAKLGEGGMGEVFLAEDTNLDRKVALKFLPRHFSADSEARTRFQREAKALAALNHPSIVYVHEVGEHEGQPYIAMEYIEGQSLRSLANPSADQVIDIAMQVAEGLATAHKSEIVHRDIKSENIVRSSDGRVKIMDFGLATWRGVTTLTKEGSTVGTIAYMSPEQVMGKTVDQRSDLWSVGVVLYELLTKRLPFTGDHDAAISYAITNEQPEPIARYKSSVPTELERIVSKCLTKNSGERYQSASALLSDLAALKSGSSIRSAPGVLPDPQSRRWGIYAGIAVVAVLAVVLPRFFGNKSRDTAEATRLMLAVVPFENLGSSDQEFFADGITEEITTQVAKVSSLGVISRTSAVKYKDTEKSLKQIGSELGVNYVLEGTIRWDQSVTPARVRINTQLIRVADDTHLWAETYDRELEHIFATQSDIARQVVSALNVTLLETEDKALAAKPTSNLKAYEAYLRGIEFINIPNFAARDARNAIRMFEEAVRLDTNFALAYAELTDAYSLLHFIGVEDRAGLLDKAQASLERALTLDPESPDALRAAGILVYRRDRDYETALKYLERADKLRPQNREIIGWKAAVYRRRGDFVRAVELYRKASAFDPLDSWVQHEIGFATMRMRRYDEAIAAFDRSIELAPEQDLDFGQRAFAYWLKNGDLNSSRLSLSLIPRGTADIQRLIVIQQEFMQRNFKEALELLESNQTQVFLAQDFYGPVSLYRGNSLKWMGRDQEARLAYESALAELEAALAENPDDYRICSSMGVVCANLGRKDDAVRFGNRGIELFPVSKDAITGPVRHAELAEIYTILGDYDAAMDQIEYLMSIPSLISVAILQLDPRWGPLKDHPRMKALIQRGDKVF
jgi:non-specific serine/threonine protein kinase